MPIQELGPESWRVAYEGDPLTPACEAQTEEEARHSDEVAEHRTEGYGKVAFFLMLNVGLILTAVAMVLFKTPNHLAFGGTTAWPLSWERSFHSFRFHRLCGCSTWRSSSWALCSLIARP